MSDPLADFNRRSWASVQAEIDAAPYTIAMREKDAEIHKLLPRRQGVAGMCFCTGACRPENEKYQGACVGVPRYHLAGQFEIAAERANRLLNSDSR